jgi:hypothetical protein
MLLLYIFGCEPKTQLFTKCAVTLSRLDLLNIRLAVVLDIDIQMMVIVHQHLYGPPISQQKVCLIS